MESPRQGAIVLGSFKLSTLDSVDWTTALKQGKTFAYEVVFETADFIYGVECMLLTKAILSNEELITEASKTPSGSALGEDTSFEIRHSLVVKGLIDKQQHIRNALNAQANVLKKSIT